MQSFVSLFSRDLDKLSQEIKLFSDEKNLWSTTGGINNSPGNLCLHLIGNLNHFIGHVIGASGYVRDRDKEFNTKNVPRDKLLKMIDETKVHVKNSLDQFPTEKMQETYPIQVFGTAMTYEFFIIHLIGHLNYHLGQINYYRRIIELS